MVEISMSSSSSPPPLHVCIWEGQDRYDSRLTAIRLGPYTIHGQHDVISEVFTELSILRYQQHIDITPTYLAGKLMTNQVDAFHCLSKIIPSPSTMEAMCVDALQDESMRDFLQICNCLVGNIRVFEDQKLEFTPIESTDDAISNMRRIFLAFRMSLDSEEINRLHDEALLYWCRLMTSRGATKENWEHVNIRLKAYFVNDSLPASVSLRLEAQLLLDMRILLDEWEKKHNISTGPSTKEMVLTDIQIPSSRIWGLLALAEGFGVKQLFVECAHRLHGLIVDNNHNGNNQNSDTTKLSLISNPTIEDHLLSIVTAFKDFYVNFGESITLEQRNLSSSPTASGVLESIVTKATTPKQSRSPDSIADVLDVPMSAKFSRFRERKVTYIDELFCTDTEYNSPYSKKEKISKEDKKDVLSKSILDESRRDFVSFPRKKLFVEPSNSSAPKGDRILNRRRMQSRLRQVEMVDEGEDLCIGDCIGDGDGDGDGNDTSSAGNADDEVNDCESGSYWDRINSCDDSDGNSSISSKKEGSEVIGMLQKESVLSSSLEYDGEKNVSSKFPSPPPFKGDQGGGLRSQFRIKRLNMFSAKEHPTPQHTSPAPVPEPYPSTALENQFDNSSIRCSLGCNIGEESACPEKKSERVHVNRHKMHHRGREYARTTSGLQKSPQWMKKSKSLSPAHDRSGHYIVDNPTNEQSVRVDDREVRGGEESLSSQHLEVNRRSLESKVATDIEKTSSNSVMIAAQSPRLLALYRSSMEKTKSEQVLSPEAARHRALERLRQVRAQENAKRMVEVREKTKLKDRLKAAELKAMFIRRNSNSVRKDNFNRDSESNVRSKSASVILSGKNEISSLTQGNNEQTSAKSVDREGSRRAAMRVKKYKENILKRKEKVYQDKANEQWRKRNERIANFLRRQEQVVMKEMGKAEVSDLSSIGAAGTNVEFDATRDSYGHENDDQKPAAPNIEVDKITIPSVRSELPELEAPQTPAQFVARIRKSSEYIPAKQLFSTGHDDLLEEFINNRTECLTSSSGFIFIDEEYEKRKKFSRYGGKGITHERIAGDINEISELPSKAMMSALPSAASMSTPKNMICMRVDKAWGLVEMLTDTNPYVVVDWGDLGVAKTQTVWNSTDPQFEATLQFKFPECADFTLGLESRPFDLKAISGELPTIRVSVYSTNRSICDDLLGTTLLEPFDLLERTLVSVRPHSACPIEIYGTDGDITGYIELKTYTVT